MSFYFDPHQVNISLQVLVDRLQEELIHPSQENGVDPSATLEDYCRHFFLKKDVEEATKEQNQLLKKITLYQKICILELEQRNALMKRECRQINEDCHEIDRKLSEINSRVEVSTQQLRQANQESEQAIQESRQIIDDTRLIQGKIAPTIAQCFATLNEIRVYTTIPTQEELNNGQEQNPLLRLGQKKIDLLDSHLLFMRKLIKEKEERLAALRGSAPNFRATNQKCDEAMEMIKRQMQKLQQDSKELAQGVEELHKDGMGLAQGVEEIRRDGMELAQGIKVVGRGTTQFTHDVDRLSQRTDKVTEDLQDGVQKSQQLIEKFNTLLTSSPHSSSRLLDVQQQRASNAVFFRAIIIGIGVNLPDHGNFSLSFLTKIRSTFVNCMNVFQFFSLYQIYTKNKQFSQTRPPFPTPSSTEIRSI
jgi:chromosome segregation ATPase